MSLQPQIVSDEPDRLPVTLGRLADFAADPILCMRALQETHGELAALQEDAQRLYFVFGPEYNRQVLSDAQHFESQFFAIRGPRKSAQRRVTSGLLSMNGDEHKRHRRMVMGPFQKKALSEYHDHVVDLGRDMLAGWKPGQVRDIGHDMTHYMLRLTTAILFGVDVPEFSDRLGMLTERWVSLNHRIGTAALISNLQLSRQYDELLLAAEELEVAVRELIALRRGGTLGQDVLSLLLRAYDENGGISDDQLVGHIALLFGAAHLTSAHTLTWTLFLLAQHPEVMQSLHGELTETLGGQAPRGDQLDSLTALDRVIRESMRILPASAYSQRVVGSPVSLGPFQLSRGAVVIFSQFMTHHSPQVFPEPAKFIPDRWKTWSAASHPEEARHPGCPVTEGRNSPPMTCGAGISVPPGLSPYAYLPFGAGPRMCIGAALGMMQLKISLPMILSRFKLSVVPWTTVNGRVTSTMLYPTSPLMMRVDRHDGEFDSVPVSGNIHSLLDLPPATMPDVIPFRRVA